MTSLRVGAVQAEPEWLDVEKGTEKTLDLIADAAARGVDILGFPETWKPGYPVFLWSPPVLDQMRFVGAMQVVDVAGVRLGALNWWEHLQPLVKYAMYAQHEQVHVAAWPCFGILQQVPALGIEANMAVTQTYALEGSTFVIAPARSSAPRVRRCSRSLTARVLPSSKRAGV